MGWVEPEPNLNLGLANLLFTAVEVENPPSPFVLQQRRGSSANDDGSQQCETSSPVMVSPNPGPGTSPIMSTESGSSSSSAPTTSPWHVDLFRFCARKQNAGLRPCVCNSTTLLPSPSWRHGFFVLGVMCGRKRCRKRRLSSRASLHQKPRVQILFFFSDDVQRSSVGYVQRRLPLSSSSPNRRNLDSPFLFSRNGSSTRIDGGPA